MSKTTMLNYIRQQSRKISRTAFILLLLLMFLISEGKRDHVLAHTFKNSGPSADKLAYTVNTADGKTSLMVYDPQNGTTTPVHTDTKAIKFSFSVDGRLAYSSELEGNAQIYIVDTISADSTPINISQNLSANAYPLAWSPDGRYLAFESYVNENDKLIYVWDGKTAVNITPNDLTDAANFYPVTWSPDGHYLAFVSYHYDKNRLIYVWDGKTTTNITPTDLVDTAKSIDEISWSFDGRLAFTLFFTFSFPYSGDPSEIYLWNGHTSTSLSQTPIGDDRGATWSADGRLAFLSDRGGKYSIYVWDGVSVKNGSPNIETFTDVAPKLTAYYSFPAWTSNGLLAFESQAAQDSHAQIYLWDGQTATNISQNPTMHNGSQKWSADGRWTFSTFFSAEQLVYVRAADNNALLTVEGSFPVWSSSGYLMYCTEDRPGWKLSIWDGQQIVKITQGREIWARWQSGGGNDCSSG